MGITRGRNDRSSRQRQKAEIRRRLEEARSKLFEAITGLTEEQMRRRPGPGRWSVAEIMAHLPVWERQLLRQADSLRGATGRTVTFPSQAEREEAAGRGQRLPPPGIVHDLVAARWNTLSFLEQLSARDLNQRGYSDERGDLTVAQILVIIAEHEEEQAAQIQQLREELGLPVTEARLRPSGAAGSPV
jgi:hypothetical protein